MPLVARDGRSPRRYTSFILFVFPLLEGTSFIDTFAPWRIHSSNAPLVTNAQIISEAAMLLNSWTIFWNKSLSKVTVSVVTKDGNIQRANRFKLMSHNFIFTKIKPSLIQNIHTQKMDSREPLAYFIRSCTKTCKISLYLCVVFHCSKNKQNKPKHILIYKKKTTCLQQHHQLFSRSNHVTQQTVHFVAILTNIFTYLFSLFQIVTTSSLH